MVYAVGAFGCIFALQSGAPTNHETTSFVGKEGFCVVFLPFANGGNVPFASVIEREGSEIIKMEKLMI